MPTARDVTVDLSKISGSRVKAWWFDPASGDVRSAGVFENRGLRTFSPPAGGDWVLVVDDVAKNLPAPRKALLSDG
jgi:hypothetical protein